MSKITELLSAPIYQKVEKDIESFVNEKLKNYAPVDIEAKTIHDSVWGSVEYSEWEMQIIDSPLFQRLRDINQVGLAMLTYPAARHSRFEHSLGVASAAKKMCEKIKTNSPNFSFSEDTKNCIYLAALLHDIGHCFYSHLSESIYGELDDFVKLRAEFNRILERKPKPHEILSFMIVNTKSFKSFFSNNVNFPNKATCRATLFHDIGRMIIGANIERNNRISSFQTAIINGPFDADKLDYIKRDSFTAGLSLSYDIERLYTKIIVHSISTNGDKIEDRLVIKFNGVTAIEELTFCKIMLYSYIYYHQKVLITETMIKDYIYGLCSLDIIKNLGDFLRYTDSEILNLSEFQANNNPFPAYAFIDLNSLSLNIKNRKLPKRCFEISQSNIESTDKTFDASAIRDYCINLMKKCQNTNYTIEEIESDVVALSPIIMRKSTPSLDDLVSQYRELTYEKSLTLRKEFYDELVEAYKRNRAQVNFSLFDIYIVFPKLVSYGSAMEKIVLGKDNKELMTINDFVKLDDWAGSFNSNKWRGYVFVTDKIDRSIAFNVAVKFILKGKARLKNPSSYLKGIED